MKNLGRWLILGGSIVALSLAVFLGYWWIVERPTPPGMDQAKEAETAPPSELDVTLPGNLQDQMAEERDRRDRLYEQAIEYHREGRLNEAVQNYRDAIALSTPDHTAAESYRLLGDIYIQNDEPNRAVRLYEYAVELGTDNPLYRYRLGKAHETIGQFDEASDAYEQAIEIEPKGLYYLARGNLSFDQGRYDEAVQFYNEGLEFSDQRQRLLINVGFAHDQLEQPEQAREAYVRARETELPTDLAYRVAQNLGELYMRLGEPTSAVNEFERAVELNSTVEANYNLGQARLKADLLSGAVDALETARDLAPDDVEILTDLGFAYQQVGSFERAVRHYRRALEQDPDNTDLYFAVARLYEKSNQPRRSLIFYRELTERLLPGPELALVWRRVGELYMNNNQPDSAGPAFRNAMKIDENNDELHYNLGLSYHREGRVDDAVEQFETAFNLDNSDTHYQFVYGVTLFRAGFRERAREVLLDLYQRSPDRFEAGYMVAYIDYSWGRLDRARNRFQGLLSDVEDPNFQSAIYQNLGNIYVREEKHGRAETALNQALSIREDPVTFYNLGIVFAERGDWEEANSSFRLALENGPEDARVYAALGMSLYERGLYEDAEEQLQRALELDPTLTRARYDLRRVREELEEAS